LEIAAEVVGVDPEVVRVGHADVHPGLERPVGRQLLTRGVPPLLRQLLLQLPVLLRFVSHLLVDLLYHRQGVLRQAAKGQARSLLLLVRLLWLGGLPRFEF
jgi:hypothetical protein